MKNVVEIINVVARQILDSRCFPTVEVEVILEDGTIGRAAVPSGASTGIYEAVELRDGNKDYFMGKGVQNAVKNVNEVIAKELIGFNVFDQTAIDKKLIELDGTDNKGSLGANAILGVSLAVAQAASNFLGLPLYQYVGGVNAKVLPVPMMNIINGGSHADNSVDLQEFMVMPVGFDSFDKAIQACAEVYHSLKKTLNNKGYSTGVGDEGGFAPDLAYNTLALDLIVNAIKKAGYISGKEVFIALDVAASELFEDGKYKIDNKLLSADEMIEYYELLIKKYPIISIEDPFDENDFASFAKLTNLIGNKVMLVGDDYFVTNSKYLIEGVNKKAGNAILLKANQIGTVTEMIKTITLARKNKYRMVISHRSGETQDTFIADFAVGLNIPFIKTGSLSRGERVAKYNRLMKIEENLNNMNKVQK